MNGAQRCSPSPTAPAEPAWDLDELRPDPAGASPLYLQIVERIAAAITCGRFKDGEALPAERVLSERLDVSRTTVRKALDELTARGLITSRQGSGNFVAARLEQPLAGLSSFSEDMRARGRRPGFVWVERGAFRALARGGDRPGAGQRRAGGAVRARAAGRRRAAGGRARRHRRPRSARARGGRNARSTRPCGRAGWSRSAHCSICAPPRSAPPTPSISASPSAAR